MRGCAVSAPVLPWPLPRPFLAHAGPPFPLESLPTWVGDFAYRLAHYTQTPPDLSSMLCLAALSVACAGKARVRLSNGHSEPLNLFVLVAMPPGSRKSEVLKQVVRPLLDFEAAAEARLGANAREVAARRKALERARDGTKDPEEAAEKERELAALPGVTLPRLFTTDATPEKLCGLLAEQGGRFAVLSAEASIVGTMGGRYSQGAPSLDVFLQGHAGDPLRVDRMGREGERVDSPALTLGLAIQPFMLQQLASIPGARERGLLGRFLYALPEDTVGRRTYASEAVAESSRSAWSEGLARLLAVPASGPPAVLRLSHEASSVHETFDRALEPRLDGERGDLADFRDWAGKLPGAVARLAGLLHMAEEGPRGEVSGDTMERATGLGRYLLDHARVALEETGADQATEDARAVLRLVRCRRWWTLTERDAYMHRRALRSDGRAAAALRVLCERHYLRPVQSERADARPGRPSSPRYEVNPAAHNPHNPQSRPTEGGSVDSANCAAGARGRLAPVPDLPLLFEPSGAAPDREPGEEG